MQRRTPKENEARRCPGTRHSGGPPVGGDVKHAELLLEALRQSYTFFSVVHVVDGYGTLDFIFHSGLLVNWSDLHVPRVTLPDFKLKTTSRLGVLRQHVRSPAQIA